MAIAVFLLFENCYLYFVHTSKMEDDLTLWQLAVENENLNEVESMILEGFDPDELAWPDHFVALSRAIWLDNVQMVHLLLAHGAKPYYRNQVSLAIAVEMNNRKMVEYLLKWSWGDEIDREVMRCSIGRAMEHENWQMLNLLLEADSCRRSSARVSRNAVLLKAVQLGNLHLCRWLISTYGCDVNDDEYCGLTPIHFAAKHNHLEVLKFLTEECEVDTNRMSVQILQEALCTAIHDDNWPMLNLLLKADSRRTSSTRISPIELLSKAAAKGSVHLCQWLIATYKCDVNTADHSGHTALDMAARHNRLDLVKYLVEKCSVDVFRENGKVLESAISRDDNVQIIKYLLEQAYNLRGDVIWWNRQLLRTALKTAAEDSVAVFLRWGMNNVIHETTREPLPSLFYVAALHGRIRTMKLLKLLYPECMKEDWIVAKNIPTALAEAANREDPNFISQLLEQAKEPLRMCHLARNKLWKSLGYNPLRKAQMIGLPPPMVKMVQCYAEFEDLTL